MDSSENKGFTPELPKAHEKEKNTPVAKNIGKIVYWLIVAGLTINFAPFLIVAVVCTAGIGLAFVIPLYIGVFKLYRRIFKD